MSGAAREEIRQALARDQRRLCAYCERRVDPEEKDARAHPTMKIEHWDARSKGGAPLTWSNLLGVCQGETSGTRHCDTSRGDESLFLHPVEGENHPDPRRHLRWRGDGSVYSDHPGASRDIETLGLNVAPLRRARREVLEGIRRKLGRDSGAARMRALLQELDEACQAGRAPEYVEFTRFHLHRWLHKRGS